jgi:hypothetical protein
MCAENASNSQPAMSAKYISEDSIMPVSTCSHPSPERKGRENAKLQVCVGMMVQRKEMYLGWEDWHECRAH